MLGKYRNYVVRRAPRDPHLDTDLDMREEKYFFGYPNLFIILFYFYFCVHYIGINDTCVDYLLVFYSFPSCDSFLDF